MAVIGLMASSAFAGPVRVNFGAANGVPFISTEIMGVNRHVAILGPGGAAGNSPDAAANAALSYTPGQNVTAGCLINVVFTGAAFNGSVVNVCAVNGASPIHVATATPASGTTTYNFNAANSVASGGTIYFNSAATCNAVNGGQAAIAGSNQLNVLITSTTTAVVPTVQVSLTSGGGISLDPAGSANLASVRSEFTNNIAAGNHTVDYLGTLGNGTRLLPGTVLYAAMNGPGAGGPLGAANVTQAVNQYTVNGGPLGAAHNAALTAALAVTLTDTMSWQGLTKVFLFNGTNAGTCTDSAAGNLVGTGSLSGTLSLSVPAGAFNGWRGIDLAVCAIAGGNLLSIPRTIQATEKVTVSGSGAVDPSASASTIIDTWDTNAYQGNPVWMVNSSAVPTYCLINNADTSRTGTVLIDVMSSEGAVILSGTLGTIAPKTSNMATFTADSALLTGGTAVSLATLGADKRYTAKLTVTANPNNVSMTCIQTDPVTGAKRSVPVLSNSGWRQ
jgi:hypothetical protein